MEKQCIGLDIGSSSVKAVQLRKKGAGWALQAFGMQPLLPQTIVDGTIMDQGAVTQAIRQLWSRLKLKQKEVAIAIAGHSVIIKKIAVPQMTAEQLASNIRNEAEHHIPFGRDDVEIDYHVTNPANASGQTELLLVAAKKEKIADYTSVITQSGRTPVIVDVDAFALQNAYEVNYDLDPRKVVALINMGAGVTNINILARGGTVFWRDISFGGNQFSEALQREFNLAFQQAEGLKQGETVDRYSPADARPGARSASVARTRSPRRRRRGCYRVHRSRPPRTHRR